MDVSGVRDLNRLGAAELVAEALSWKMTRRRAVAVVADTVERLGEGLGSIDRGAYPGVSDDAWQVVTDRSLPCETSWVTRPVRRGRGEGALRAPVSRGSRAVSRVGGGSLRASTDPGSVAVQCTR